SSPSLSLRKTTNEPIDFSLFLAVQASIFLTSLTSSGLFSRAKTMATGFSPLTQNRQNFSPLCSPVTLIGWNGPGTFSPDCGPDLGLWGKAGGVRAGPGAAAPNGRNFITTTPDPLRPVGGRTPPAPTGPHPQPLPGARLF